MEVINSWYRDAEQLLQRTIAVTWWRDSLTSRHRVSFYGDLPSDEIGNAFRQANAKADADCDAIHIETHSMEADASALGKRFESDWTDLFYLELRNIEITHLPSGRCAFVPLQGLVWKVRDWGRELTDANRGIRKLNCAEVSNFIDVERWVLNAVDAIRERLLLERLTIAKAQGHNSPIQRADDGTTKRKQESDAGESAGNDTGLVNLKILGLYTDGLANEKIAQIATIFKSEKTLNERLEAMHSILPIPPTVSGEKLGGFFDASKSAIQKTSWYITNRKGKADENISRRHDMHKKKAKQSQADFRDDSLD